MVMALPGLLQANGDQVGFVLFPRSSPGCSGRPEVWGLKRLFHF